LTNDGRLFQFWSSGPECAKNSISILLTFAVNKACWQLSVVIAVAAAVLLLLLYFIIIIAVVVVVIIERKAKL